MGALGAELYYSIYSFFLKKTLLLFFFYSNYAPTVMIQRKAVEKGCQQVLWLYGDDHYVTEVGTMNLFMFWINENGGLMAIEIS